MKEITRDSQGRIIRYGPYPELTFPALLVGYGIGTLIAISIGYASLKLGFSIEGSELAAILGFGILRGLMGRTSIIENNINQTIASAVNGASSGLMFTVPALFILHQPDFNATLMVFACIAGGILGITFIIPLRKQMIDFERLTYPGGMAVATILKSPGAGIRKAQMMLAGMALSGGTYFVVKLLNILQEKEIITFSKGIIDFEYFQFGALTGMPEYMNATFFVSLMTIGVAFIAGKGGFSFIIGGYVCYWILAPILNFNGMIPSPDQCSDPVHEIPELMRLGLFRPIGIGMLIGGALTGIMLALPLIINAIKSMLQASKSKSTHSQDEMPVKLLFAGIAGATILLFIISIMSVKEMGIIRGGIMALLGTLWIWIAGVILSECIGRTNWSPLSGMTLIAVTILVIIASYGTKGLDNASSIIASIMVGAAACVAMSQATDLMQDLKTGYMVGASPRKQQYGQLLATWLGPIVVMALIFILYNAYKDDGGFGGSKLPAPQGQALASMINAILKGDVPVTKYAAGAGLGALLSASGIGGLGILVGLGFYLPFDVVLTYSIGTAMRLFADWKFGKRFSDDVGIPFCTGLIVGEALIGVGFALYAIYDGMAGGAV